MPGPWEKYGQQPQGVYQIPQSRQQVFENTRNTNNDARNAANDAERIRISQAQLALQQQRAAREAAQAAQARRQQTGEARSAMDQMNDLNRSVADLRNQYNTNFRGKGRGSLAEYLPAFVRPANGTFDDAAQSLLADMAKAKGLTSQQFNTPAEQKMFFQPLIPSSSDTDEQIARKIDRLQRMVTLGQSRYARQLGVGLKPAGNNQPKQNAPAGHDDEVASYLKKYGAQ